MTDMKSTEARMKKTHSFIPRKARRLLKHAVFEWKHRACHDNALPDFYIVGSMKSGTTALFMHLETNPDVAAASRKEIQYYTTNRDLGLNFYRSFFPKLADLEPCGNAYGRQVTGEATPDYIFHPAAPELCKQITPDAKFVLLMRNPVDRAFSHWKQGRRFKFETEDFVEAIALEEVRLAGEDAKLRAEPTYYSYRHQLYSYLARGRYAEQIENWLRHFNRDQFLFINADDMFESGAEISNKVSDFIGISYHPEPDVGSRFKGMEGDIEPKIRAELDAYFKPYNQALYKLVGEDYRW